MKSFLKVLIIVYLFAAVDPLFSDSGSTTGGVEPEAQDLAATPTFNFSPPGARSLGMGGTFVGIADDATAGGSNPAGLTILARPEASINFRTAELGTETINPESFFNSTTNFENEMSGLSFLSYVVPLKSKNAAFSLYYQQAANFVSHEQFRIAPFIERENRFDFLLEHLGVSGAVKLGRFVSFGASLQYSQATVRLTNRQSGIAAVIDGIPYYSTLEESIRDADKDLTFNAGLLVNQGGKLSLGLVYKRGGDFRLDANQTITVETLEPRLSICLESPLSAEFNVPDAYGIGLAYRPSSSWIFGLDLISVTYSDTRSRFEDFNDQSSDEQNVISDGTEVHLGMEYGLTLGDSNTPLFLRAGYYVDPDHDGTDRIDSKREFVTFGAGIFLKNKLQLDAAIAMADENTETLISMVWRL